MQTKVLRCLVAIIVLLTAGIGPALAQQGGAPATPPPPPSKFKLMSPAYTEGSPIPSANTCVTPNATSPALQWTGAPQATVAFALIFHDTEGAPAKSSMDVTHWILWNVPATSTQLSASIAIDATPDGLSQGKNVRGVNGYQPPCPPVGATPHHYIFELYALDSKLDLPAGSPRADLLKAMDGHVVGKAAYVGMVSR